MKYIIDIPNEMVIKSQLKGMTLGIAMIETSTQKQFIIPTNIPLMPYIEPQKWISVSERLPKQQQTVLIQDFGQITIGYLNAENRWRNLPNLDDYMKGVEAWMPLPPAYKGDE